MKSSIFCILLVKSIWALNDPVLVREVKLPNPSVCSIANLPGNTGPSVLVTEFAPFKADEVYAISDLTPLLANTSATPNITKLIGNEKWPNQAIGVPSTYFNQDDLVLVAGGFLVPGKTPGSVSIYEVGVEQQGISLKSNFIRHKISTDKNGYFYHKAMFYDMNGDGRMDIVAARANKPIIGHSHGELIWFEQPSSAPLGSAWKEHLLFTDGPDVSFIFEDINGDNKPELVATQFFTSPNLVLYMCDAKTWSECDQSTLKSVVIDGESGPFFNIEVTDLNADGGLELLVTNNRNDGTGSVFAYEVPKDLTGNWTKHTLSTGYKPKSSGMGKGAPGTASSFKPNLKDSKLPSILVSGDDGGEVRLLNPTSKPFVYEEVKVVDVKGTIGTLALGDANGDGYTDFFVPRYNDGVVDVFTFAPQTSTE